MGPIDKRWVGERREEERKLAYKEEVLHCEAGIKKALSGSSEILSIKYAHMSAATCDVLNIAPQMV